MLFIIFLIPSQSFQEFVSIQLTPFPLEVRDRALDLTIEYLEYLQQHSHSFLLTRQISYGATCLR